MVRRESGRQILNLAAKVAYMLLSDCKSAGKCYGRAGDMVNVVRFQNHLAIVDNGINKFAVLKNSIQQCPDYRLQTAQT